jgi:hypothetical protein
MVVSQVHSGLMNNRICVGKKGSWGKNYLCLLHADFFLTDTNLKRFVVFKFDK